MKLFFDTEFTGLHQNTTLISLGIVSENGKSFYAEFTDYDQMQVTPWIQKNVIDKLFLTFMGVHKTNYTQIKVKGDKADIRKALIEWLDNLDTLMIEFWSDCLAYDWVLLNGLLADYTEGYPKLPNNVYYIPFDIATMFYLKGFDPDMSREKFAYGEVYSEMLAKKHTAIWDAATIRECYNKLNNKQ